MVTGELIDPRQKLGGSIPGKIYYGIQGPPGGYYTPAVKQLDEDTLEFRFAPTDEKMPQVPAVVVELPSGKTVIPEYWQKHIDSKIAAIKALQDAGGKDTVSFAVMTDIHYPSNLGKTSPALARHIMDQCKMKYALVLGDTQNQGSYVTKELAEAEFVAVEKMLAPIADRMLRTQGNHDGSWGAPLNGINYPYKFTPEEMYNRIYRKTHMLNGVKIDSTGTAYYIDDSSNRIRYIVLNTHCVKYELNDDGSVKYNTMNTFRYTQSQYDFLTKDALITVPPGYVVAVFSHVPPNNAYSEEFGGSGGDHEIMRGLLYAYSKKRTYSAEWPGTGERRHSYTNLNGAVTVDSRLTSAGAVTSSKGAIVTDFISASKGDVLRIKGIDIKSTLPDGTNKPVIASYYSDKTINGVVYTGSTVADAVTTDTDGSTRYTLIVNNNGEQVGASNNMAYIRIAGTPIPGEEIVITLNEQIIDTPAYDAVSVDVDFSNANGEFTAYFAGHMHNDYVYDKSDWGINIITTRCDAQAEAKNELYDERVAGTTTEQSFDVFTINTRERTIYATKIGAGNDRVIPY